MKERERNKQEKWRNEENIEGERQLERETERSKERKKVGKKERRK
jgi:hypothetical protein